MQKDIHQEITTNKRDAKRRVYVISGVLLAFTLLVVAVCYQRFNVGTLYQTYRCVSCSFSFLYVFFHFCEKNLNLSIVRIS